MNQLDKTSFVLYSLSLIQRILLLIISVSLICSIIQIDNYFAAALILCFSIFIFYLTLKATTLELNSNKITLLNSWTKKVYWSIPTNHAQYVLMENGNWAYYKQRFLLIKTKDGKKLRFRVNYVHLCELNSIFSQLNVPLFIDINNKKLSYETCIREKIIGKYD